MASEYRRIRLKALPALEERETPEARFWHKFKYPVIQKLTSPATCIDFCPTTPHDFAVTSGARIVVYDYKSNKEKKVFSKFKDVAYSGKYRQDGRLLVAADARGILHVSDVNTKATLRQYRGHRGQVHSAHFSPNNVNLLSAGDDCTVRYWDMPTATQLGCIEGAHNDYIRCAHVSAATPHIWATGSYDHTVKLWDMRSVGGAGTAKDAPTAVNGSADSDADAGMPDGEAVAGAPAGGSSTAPPPSAAVLTVDHGEPVTQVLLLPGGGSALTAGGATVKVWDIVGGGRLIHSFSNHQKLVTSLALDGTGTRLLSAGLDGLVKVYEIGTFAVLHTIRYDGPILALACAPDNSRLVVGMTDNTLSIKQRIVKVAELVTERKTARLLRGGSYRYFLRGQGTPASADDIRIESGRKQKLRPYDTFLKHFQYGPALDAALASANPVVVVSMVEELVQRGGLRIALRGRDEDALEPLLQFLCRFIVDPRFASLLIDVAEVVLELYARTIGHSPTVSHLFMRLQEKLRDEAKLAKELLGLQGVLDLLMAASTAGTGGTATTADIAQGIDSDITLAAGAGGGII